MNIKSLVTSLRKFRYLHKVVGLTLALFLIVNGLTGVLLGWKKNSSTLQPPTISGSSQNVYQWKSFHEISTAAVQAMEARGNSGNNIDRMDVRPDKGIVKVLFHKGYWEVQVDAATADILSISQRHSDWIEHIHDGSIFSDLFKLIYTNILGLGLCCLAGSGLWLWYGPKVVRKLK